MSFDLDALHQAGERAAGTLLARRNASGYWTGRLASSALSTATAITALALVDRARGTGEHRQLIRNGARWLIDHQNADGGWGDTVRSFSNISTTTLCWAALSLVQVGGRTDRGPDRGADNRPSPGSAITCRPLESLLDAEAVGPAADALRRANAWLSDRAGSVLPRDLAPAITARYGRDRTFSVPILTMAVLCGCFGPGSRPWRYVPQLPFELASFPHAWFRYIQLPVVSYALPAFIGMGHVRHHHRPTRNPFTRALRALTRRRTLNVLRQIQPTNGGFLEATPLTSFVTMSLAGADLADHPVAQQGVAFLARSVRDDGSWPIDTNLATWCTTMSVNALAAGGRLDRYLDADAREPIVRWLRGQQYTHTHPYTDAPPGGWAWTDLPGGVPDADDTSGALLALAHLADAGPAADRRPPGPADVAAPDRVAGDLRPIAEAGLRWLEGLQNNDGGIPTFCRGWGALPFDRSCADITGHALRACFRWRFSTRALRVAREGQRFLAHAQSHDGSWRPLWFGNQHQAEHAEENPTYGTSRVILGLLDGDHHARSLALRGARYLLTAQNGDGGWGGAAGTPSTIEETALATEALAATLQTLGPDDFNQSEAHPTDPAPGGTATSAPNDQHGRAVGPVPDAEAALTRALQWLIDHTDGGTRFEPSPIGFYFAKLWYYEDLYPVIWTVAALQRAGCYFAEVPEGGSQLANQATTPEASNVRMP